MQLSCTKTNHFSLSHSLNERDVDALWHTHSFTFYWNGAWDLNLIEEQKWVCESFPAPWEWNRPLSLVSTACMRAFGKLNNFSTFTQEHVVIIWIKVLSHRSVEESSQFVSEDYVILSRFPSLLHAQIFRSHDLCMPLIGQFSVDDD